MANELGQYFSKLDPWATGLMRGADYNDGWLEILDTWTYVDANTVEIDGDRTAMYPVGCMVRWTQTTLKYAHCVAGTYARGKTRLSLQAGSDYTVANAAITNPGVSYVSCPRGFPQRFNWAPVQGGFSSDPANGIYRFCVRGRMVRCDIRQGADGTSDDTVFSLSLPITAATITNQYWVGSGAVKDNGTVQAGPGMIAVASAGTVMNIYKDWTPTAFTGSGAKRLLYGNIEYGI